jgi:hypothetical protein
MVSRTFYMSNLLDKGALHASIHLQTYTKVAGQRTLNSGFAREIQAMSRAMLMARRMARLSRSFVDFSATIGRETFDGGAG